MSRPSDPILEADRRRVAWLVASQAVTSHAGGLVLLRLPADGRIWVGMTLRAAVDGAMAEWGGARVGGSAS